MLSAASSNGLHIAQIASPSLIEITECPSERGFGSLFAVGISRKSTQTILSKAEWLVWSPDSYSTHEQDSTELFPEDSNQFTRAWLLVSDGRRLVVLCIDLDAGAPQSARSSLVADFDLGNHLGRYAVLDFAFGHEHALVIDALAIQASVVCLTRPERLDIANIKYADRRGLASRPNKAAFALLSRNEGQDAVTVFSMSDAGKVKSRSFSLQTNDAQIIQWCPNEPFLCVAESATYGMKVLFFTAEGHHIKHMDLDSDYIQTRWVNFDCGVLGVNTIDWTGNDDENCLAVFDNSSRLILRKQSTLTKSSSSLTLFEHHHLIDGSKCPTWCESIEGPRTFTLVQHSFDARNSNRVPGADRVFFNRSRQLLVSKDSSAPWTLCVWDVSSSILLAVVNFRERIKHLLWHPKRPGVFFIFTHQRQPLIYVWHHADLSLQIVELDRSSTPEAVEHDFRWLKNDMNGNPLLFINSSHNFDVGTIEMDAEEIFFNSVLKRQV